MHAREPQLSPSEFSSPRDRGAESAPSFRDERSLEWIAAIDPCTPGKVLERLSKDGSVALLERIAEHPNTPVRVLIKLSSHRNSVIRAAVIDNAGAPESIVSVLCGDASPDVRLRIAENHNLSTRILAKLVEDENPYVAERAKQTLRRLASALADSGCVDEPQLQQHGETPMKNAQKLKILVIEDNPADVRLLQKLLAAWPYELLCVDTLSAGLDILSARPIDLILLDLSLPDAQGIDTFYRLHCEAPSTPVVVLTGLEDESVGSEAVKAGAQDYLVKGQVLPGLLGRSINYAVERHQAETRIKQLNESLEQRVFQLAAANEQLDKLAQALAASTEQALKTLNLKSGSKSGAKKEAAKLERD